MDAAAHLPYGRRTNWSVILRVGTVIGVVALLLGFALKITWDQVVRRGMVDRGGYFEIDIKSMSNFEMDQNLGSKRDVPMPYRDADGKKVLMDGEVAPATSTTGGGEASFEICYSVSKCCVGGPPRKQHFFRCVMPAGKRTPGFIQPPNRVQVYGTLHIRPDTLPEKPEPEMRWAMELFASDPSLFFLIELERVEQS